MNKLGFTLTEILIAVIIVAVLAVMAVPLYEKTIERSRLAEARTILDRLQSAKNYSMDNMDCTTYSAEDGANCPKLKHLNIQFQFDNPGCTGTDTTVCSKYFLYSMNPKSNVAGVNVNGVCARRLGGEYAGTSFVYYGEDNNGAPFKCYGEACEAYGLSNSGTFSCGDSEGGNTVEPTAPDPDPDPDPDPVCTLSNYTRTCQEEGYSAEYTGSVTYTVNVDCTGYNKSDTCTQTPTCDKSHTEGVEKVACDCNSYKNVTWHCGADTEYKWVSQTDWSNCRDEQREEEDCDHEYKEWDHASCTCKEKACAYTEDSCQDEHGIWYNNCCVCAGGGIEELYSCDARNGTFNYSTCKCTTKCDEQDVEACQQSGGTFNYNTCECKCPDGYKNVNEECKPICDMTQQANLNRKQNCEQGAQGYSFVEGTWDNNACDCKCPSGSSKNAEGVCETAPACEWVWYAEISSYYDSAACERELGDRLVEMRRDGGSPSPGESCDNAGDTDDLIDGYCNGSEMELRYPICVCNRNCAAYSIPGRRYVRAGNCN